METYTRARTGSLHLRQMVIRSQNAVLPRASIQEKLLRYCLQSHGSTSLLCFDLGIQVLRRLGCTTDNKTFLVFLIGTALGSLLHGPKLLEQVEAQPQCQKRTRKSLAQTNLCLK